MNESLKSAAEELFWLTFALVLAWYSAVSWPLTSTLSTWKFTLLYLPFAALLVFAVKEGFSRYCRFVPLALISLCTGLSLISVFILYVEYARQFFRDQIPPLSEALKANDLMNIWGITAQQPKEQPYFLTVAASLVVLLIVSTLRTGFLIPRNR